VDQPAATPLPVHHSGLLLGHANLQGAGAADDDDEEEDKKEETVLKQHQARKRLRTMQVHSRQPSSVVQEPAACGSVCCTAWMPRSVQVQL
jgi:hypothetical protein